MSGLHWGINLGMSAVVTPFLVMDPLTLVVDGLAYATASASTLLEFLVVCFFCERELGQLAPLLFHGIHGDFICMMTPFSIIGVLIGGESWILPLEITCAIVIIQSLTTSQL